MDGATVARSGLAALTALTLSACDWVQSGFDAGNTNHNPNESTLTADNVHELTEVWATDVAAGKLFEPIVRDGTVYALSAAEETTAASVDASTGETKWRKTGLLPTDPNSGLERYPGPMIFHDGQLQAPYTVYLKGGDLTIDPASGDATMEDGSAVFQLADKDGLATRWGAFAPPDLAVLYVSWQAGWRPTIVGTPGETQRSFSIVGERVLWSQGNNALGFASDCPKVADDDRCEANWTTDLGAAVSGRPVAIGDDRVLYSAGGKIHALDTETGVVQWTATAAGPAAVGGDTIVVADGDRVLAFAADGCGASTCDPLWRTQLGGAAGRPTVAGDVVYATGGSTGLAAIGLDGCGASTCEPLLEVNTHRTLTGSPVVAHGQVYLTDDAGTISAWGLPAS